MGEDTLAIEINFPVPVELTGDDQRILQAIAAEICERYETAHPERVMWPAGMGSKITENLLKLSDDEPIPFDDSVFAIDCAERENYDWLCEKCGIAQGDHAHCIIDPPAGDCEFAPAAGPPKVTPPRGLVPMRVYLSAVNGRKEMRDAVRTLRTTLSRQAELLGLAAKALKPFADGLQFYRDDSIDNETFLDWSENIKVGDLRTASSTLDAIRDELKGDANGE